MTEKEKMLNGELYCAWDKQLSKERAFAAALVYKYNKTSPVSLKKRKKILYKLFCSIKGTIAINSPFYCDYGYNIEVGNNFYTNVGCIILDVNKVKIGENVLFGPNVHIYTAGHPVEPKKRLTMMEFGLPITIGNNVWIGGSVVICPGVAIGNNVTIGAGSIVTKDIPDNAVAVGNPCKVIKKV